MIVQNQNTAWVSLALIVLCMAVAFGVILTRGSLGPSQDVKDEQARVSIRATEAALNAIQTSQAVFAGQTAIVAELTAMPPAQTATVIAGSENHVAIQQAATQTAIANSQYIGNLMVAATATTIANTTSTKDSTRTAAITLAIFIIATFCLWIIGHTFVKVLTARAQDTIAHTQLLNEQRQLAEFRANHQRSSRPTVQPSIPTSLMKQRGNGHERSRVE